MSKHPFQHSPHDQEPEKTLELIEKLEPRSTTVRWISADGSEHGMESTDQDEITVRCLVLLLKWQKGEVLKIIIEE